MPKTPNGAAMGKAGGKALRGAAYRAYKRLDPNSVIREGEIPTRANAPKFGRRRGKKQNARQRAIEQLRTRRRGKRLGRGR